VLAVFLNIPVVRRAAECLAGVRMRPMPQAQDPEGRLRRVHVVYSGDSRSLGGMFVSMHSLARAQAEPAMLTIHVIAAPEDMANITAMVGCWRAELADMPAMPVVELHELRPLPFDPSNNTFGLDEGGVGIGTATLPSCWLRVWLGDYLPHPRVIWLDHDVLVYGDITPLYRMRMEHPLAAASEWIKPDILQAGVLLIDLDRFRTEGLPDEMLDKVRRYHEFTTKFSDQDILNHQFPLGKRDVLDWRWNTGSMGINFMSEEEKQWLPKSHPVEVIGVGIIQWSSRVIYDRCLDQVKLIHLNWGPKFWWKNQTFPRCDMVKRVAPRNACMGWKLSCDL